MTAELSLVIPTLNENDNMEPLIRALEKALEGVSWEVIVVDDDSTDGTSDTVRELARRDPRIRCIQRIGRRGLSSACIEGMLASSAPYLAVMDADMQHDETLLSTMLELIKRDGLDIVSGSRYAAEGSTGELAPGRVRISRLANSIQKRLLKADLTDAMSGFFMLRREFFDRTVHRLSGKGFKILLDLYLSADGDVRFAELPYVMRARRHGESKLSILVALEYILMLADKLLGWAIPVRFVLFSIVGLSGVLVHLAVLGALFGGMGVAFVTSQAVATLIAMTTNYFLNNIFTYRDHRRRGLGILGGLLAFYLACSVGAVVNVLLAQHLFGLGIAWWLAGGAGIIVGSVWNFAVTSTFIWLRPEGRQ